MRTVVEQRDRAQERQQAKRLAKSPAAVSRAVDTIASSIGSRTIDKHERLLLSGIQNQIIAKGDTAVRISNSEMHTLTGIGRTTVKEAKERLDGKFPWLEISNKSKTTTYRFIDK